MRQRKKGAKRFVGKSKQFEEKQFCGC